jgi:beta-barrel assembly-enhancing protease
MSNPLSGDETMQKMSPRSALQRPSRSAMAQVILLSGLSSGLLLGGCATLGLGGFNIISIEQEWELGREIEEEIAQQLTLSNDAQVVAYLRDLGERVVAGTPMADLDWRFHVVEDDAVNAFNAPGGLVYVNTGLIATAENASELVAVLAHEVGHGVARHGTQRLSQQYGVAVLAGLVLGEDPGLVAEIAASIAAAGTMARFSREDEFEADEMGLRYAPRAGYTPQGMVTFFGRLLEMQEREPGSVENFFSTHPATRERIDRAEGLIAEMGSLSGLATNDDRFPGVRSRVR